VAELDAFEAAQALDVAPATYRHALARAIETLRSRGIDEARLHDVRDSLQRDAIPRHAMHVQADLPIPPPPPSARWARRARPMLAIAVAVLAAAFVASFVWVPPFLRGGGSFAGFQTLREHAPAARLSADQALIAGDDFEVLADPQGERLARDLDLFAWYAANAPTAGTGAAPSALPETTLPESASSEADTEEGAEGASGANDTALPVAPGRPAAAPKPAVASPAAPPPSASHKPDAR